MKSMTSSRVLKSGKQPALLPIPAVLRQRCSVEKWGDRIWRVRHKYLVMLEPQHRDLMRKLACSMQRADLHHMVILQRTGLFLTWTLTGSVGKMEQLIRELINRRVFLMPSLCLPENTSADLPERFTRLLYDPKCYPGGLDATEEQKVMKFETFLGPVPQVKPWLDQWAAEKEEVHESAAAELGRVMADKLWAEFGRVHAIGDSGGEDKNLRNWTALS